VQVEYALGYGWSARDEYLFEDFGRNNTIFHPANENLETFMLNHVFRVGLNYRFW
jgi:opacity protein-like surface antigen